MLRPTVTHQVIEADRALKKLRSEKAATVAFAVSVPLAIWGAWMTNWYYQPFNPDMWIITKGWWFGHFLGTWEVVRRGVYATAEETGN